MYTVILPAAGTGSRMNLGYNKLLHKIGGRTIIEHTVAWFLNDIKCTQIIIVVSANDQAAMSDLFNNHPRVEIALGGPSRQESIYNALEQIREDIVMIHDGARPFINQNTIDNCYEIALKGLGAVVAVTPKDTIKQRHSSKLNIISRTLTRNTLVAIQTPQAFPTSVFKKANELAKNAKTLGTATDDASLVEKYTEIDVKIIDGNYKNIKFTTVEDIEYFEFLMRRK